MRGTPEEIAKEIRKRANALRTEAEAGIKEMAAVTMAQAKKDSLGPYTTPMLVRMGHPYAKRDPRPPMPPFYINIQTGNLYRSWQKRYGASAGAYQGTILATVFNTSPEAGWLERGNGPSIKRPLPHLVVVQVGAQFRSHMQQRIKGALKI